MIKKQRTLLSFNIQQGSFIPESDIYLKNLLDRGYDYYHFQRFPLKWLSNIKTQYFIYSIPSYPGADNGQVTLVKEKPLSSLKFYSSERTFKASSQSNSSILLRYPHLSLLNTLPPYRSKEDDLTIEDTLNHIRYVFNSLNGPSIVSGDLHETDQIIQSSIPKDFRIINTKNNFADANKKMIKLTKLIVNFQVRLKSEEVLKLNASNVTHYPSVFHFES